MMQKMILQALLHSLLSKSDKSMASKYDEPDEVTVEVIEGEIPGLEQSDLDMAKDEDIDVEALLRLFKKEE